MSTDEAREAREGRGLSVRWRLTIVYTSITVASAAVLLAGIYVLVSLRQTGRFVSQVEPFHGELPPVADDLLVRRALVDARVDAVDNTLRNLLLWSGAGLVLMAAVSVWVGWLFAGRALRPVHTITSRARRISADSLDDRLALDGPHDELREMADTFDSLLDRIEDAFRSERRLVATMSHELRTPLANQRAALDVALADPGADAAALRRTAEVVRGQAVRAQRTVDALLTLARAQAADGAEPPSDPVDLGQLVDTVLGELRAQHAELDWDVHLDAVRVRADGDLLERAVDNLLSNAVVHNRPGGWVRVRVGLDEAVGSAVVEVENSGPVLAPETVASLTLPFRRGTSDRTSSSRGTGLGLSIVQAVADHHAAELTLEPLDEGGLRARLSLPLAR